MTLHDLLSTLRFPVYMKLRDEDNMEIIYTIKSDSPALSNYLNCEIVNWGIKTRDELIVIPRMFVLIKGDTRE